MNYFSDVKPKLNLYLKGFGMIGVVTTKDKIQVKLRNRGRICMFFGYTDNDSRDMFCMLKVKTHGVINYRDVVCLKKCIKIG
jgi:hypothetical protein